MGFLDTIGQRTPVSRPQGTQPAFSDYLTFDNAGPAPHTAPQQESPQSNRIHAAVIWSAGLIVIAAIAVGAWLGMRQFAPVAAPQTEASADAAPATPAPTKKPGGKRRAVRAASTVRSDAQPAIGASTSEAGLRAADEASTDGPVSQVANVTEAAATPIAVSDSIAAAAVAVPEDNYVYSSDGAGVVAPSLVSLGFVHRVVNGFATRTSTLELLVSKNGTVERAKLFPPSRNWEDAMLLSRAKTFQFVPAQRDGLPVRYRYVLEVDTTP